MASTTASHGDHLPGCPAALSIAGWHEDCRCDELATLFDVPTRAECFADPDVAAAHARWVQARAEAQARLAGALRAVKRGERDGLAQIDEIAARRAAVDADIVRARELLNGLASGGRTGAN